MNFQSGHENELASDIADQSRVYITIIIIIVITVYYFQYHMTNGNDS